MRRPGVGVDVRRADALLDAQRVPRRDLREGREVTQAARVLALHLGLAVDRLALTARGSWEVELDNEGVVELGRGTEGEIVAPAQRFVQTLNQVTSRYGRTPEALVSADLRHTDGYALRLRGVVTTDAVKK